MMQTQQPQYMDNWPELSMDILQSPQSWKTKLVDRALIEYLAEKLYQVRFKG